MDDSARNRHARYRLWITHKRGNASPPDADPPSSTVVLEPAERGTMSLRQAARYVAAFNQAAQSHGRPVRAIALPVALRYEGDPVPGQLLEVEGATASAPEHAPPP